MLEQYTYAHARQPISKRALAGSLGAHALVISLLVAVGSAPEAPVAKPEHPHLYLTELAPPPERIVAPPRPVAPRRARVTLPMPQLAEKRPAPPAPLPEAAPPPPPPAPVKRVEITLPEKAAVVPQPVKRPEAPVTLGSFSSPVTAKTQLARIPAVTGAFASASDAPAKPERNSVTTGGFGEASAARSSREGVAGGTVGGFGDAVAALGPGPGGGGQVRAGGFQGAQAVGAREASVQPVRGGNESPVAILDKPRPNYTEEARRLKIEGEVVLEVSFTASGKARVLRVIQGLGYGLDESAVQAAEAIRFRPATRGGVPVDATAVARIVFQLAY